MYRYFVSFAVDDSFGNCEITVTHLISNFDDIKYITDKVKTITQTDSTPIVLFYKRLYDE